MIHMQADQKLWERMAKSWLSPEEINQLAQERLDDRINTLTGDLKFLNKFPSANFYVKEVLERHIEKIPEMWEKAKARAPKVEQKEKFEPGIWSEEELAARKGKISSLLNMVDAFCKYAKTG